MVLLLWEILLLLVRQMVSRDQQDFIYMCEIFLAGRWSILSVPHPKSILYKNIFSEKL